MNTWEKTARITWILIRLTYLLIGFIFIYYIFAPLGLIDLYLLGTFILPVIGISFVINFILATIALIKMRPERTSPYYRSAKRAIILSLPAIVILGACIWFIFASLIPGVFKFISAVH